MAKQPIEIRDRFRITADVEATALGPLLAQLAKIGLQNVGYELVTDVVMFNKNGPRVLHPTTGDEFAREWLKEHPTFRAVELIHHFQAAGRTNGSGYTAIRNLVASGEIIKVSVGNYTRSDIKAIAPPAKKAAAPEKARRAGRGQTPRYDVRNLDLIMKFIQPKSRVTVAEVGALLVKEGRNKKSASPIISKLATAKVLKQIEPGTYAVMKRADKAAAALNGAAAHGS